MNEIVITKDVLAALLVKQREDIRKGICTAEEAQTILGLGITDFYAEAASPDTRLVRSKKRGKYIFSSVALEFERIHGVPYKEAILN